MNKNSNTYQIVYSAIMVIIVGAVLALIYMILKPQQDINRDNDTRKQILAAINVKPENDEAVATDYETYIVKEYLVNEQGAVTDSSQNVAFGVDMGKNMKEAQRKLPVFVAKVKDEVKYIIPVYGAGLWGPIWGYVAVNADGQSIYGTNFSHQGETPGLGAKITEDDFQKKFEGKHIYMAGAFNCVEVMKKGQKSLKGAETIDAISGATITSRGVSAMMDDCLKPYDAFFKTLQGSTTK
ncbi:MAG: NADH:ubiquinone reductase (Na(+)-transporting) subunit C [Bacteroidales bacterium]|nr:NADH:ubiquinone reductase (Na(+)-transporting) subunit C [Bacteroidales bacterium]